MNSKMKMFLISSALVISLVGCNKNNSMQEDSSQMMQDAKEVTQDAENEIENPDGNYKTEEDGKVIDDSKDGNLEDDVENMMTESEAIQTMAKINFDELEKLDNTKQGWGQGKNLNDKNQPIDAVNFQTKYGKYNAYFIRDLDKKNVYLTFDEGYENGYTAPILDVLKDKGVSAVFFVTLPYVKQNPDLINRMISEGHIVGNHSVKHKSFPTISVEEGQQEVEGLHNYMKENYNYDMTLFRFPLGEFSERSLELLNKLGYKSIFWSYAYADWDPNKKMEPAKAKDKIISAAHDGAIYLLHAVSKTNAEILGDVIDQLKASGYDISKF